MDKSKYATDIKHYLSDKISGINYNLSLNIFNSALSVNTKLSKIVKSITFKIIVTGMIIELTLIANIILQIK